MQTLLNILQEIDRRLIYWTDLLNHLDNPATEYPYLIEIHQSLKNAKTELTKKIEEMKKREPFYSVQITKTETNLNENDE